MFKEIAEGYVLFNVIFAIITVILIILWFMTKNDIFSHFALLTFIIALPF